MPFMLEAAAKMATAAISSNNRIQTKTNTITKRA
jgi:hypothetical protein